jgi:predicted nucleic acid-binding protein
MRLDKVLDGSVYVDTNVLYMYLRADPNHLPKIRLFLERMVRGELQVFVGIPVLDELLYRLLLARVKDATGQNPLNVLHKDLVGAIATHGNVIEAAVRKLAALPNLELVGVKKDDLNRMLNNMNTFFLLPRDALHLAIVQRLDIMGIASDDTDFDRVAGLNRHWVVNPPGGQ